MKAFILLGLFTVVISISNNPAWADNNPRFSYEAAQLAFKTAPAPTAKDMVGKWVVVGRALVNPMDKNIQYGLPGYWPDGRVSLPMINSEPFSSFENYEQIPDAFGGLSLVDTDTIVGLNTGKIYYTSGTVLNTVTSTGIRSETDPDPGNATCGGYAECRIAKTNGMLICAIFITKISGNCSVWAPYLNSASIYTGMTRAK